MEHLLNNHNRDSFLLGLEDRYGHTERHVAERFLNGYYDDIVYIAPTVLHNIVSYARVSYEDLLADEVESVLDTGLGAEDIVHTMESF